MFSESKSDLGQKIVNLRKQGLSYSEISKKLNCNKSTISYHCSQSSRDKSKERCAKHRFVYPWKHKFSDKVSNFKLRVYDNTPYHKCED
jgi:orotate phosphoribosyltransferase-like protein